jgi:hypothetical protein
LNYNSNKATYKDFLGVWELSFVSFGGLFSEFLTPSTFGGHNFFNPIMCLMIFCAFKALIEGVQVLFGHHK